jgi:hypothetical protein
MAGIQTLIHGQKPEIVKFKETDPIEMLGKLLRGEISEWPSIVELGNLFQSDVFKKLEQSGLDLQSLISLGGQNAQQTGLNALALQEGKLPPEVVKELFRTSAMQNLQSGLFGSQAGSANQLRQLGIGTLEGMKQGAELGTVAGNAAQRWAQIALSTTLPASSFLYTPEWFTNYMAEQEAARESAKQLQFNAAAAPDPAAAGIAGTVTGIIGAIYGKGGGGNYSDYQGQYAKSTQGLVPTASGGYAPSSQYPGVVGSVSNFLGGNLHTGGTPYLQGGYSSDVSNPGTPVFPRAEAVPSEWWRNYNQPGSTSASYPTFNPFNLG